MEVHHHPHLPHGPKKFKEYFLEFLMIFLAVTMGFLAENLREHIADNRKEKEFVAGFIADLKADTAKLTAVIKYYDHILPLMDSTRINFSLLQKPHSLHTVMMLQRSMAGYMDFIYSDATLQQVKSSGGMLLIKNKATVDSMLAYDSKVQLALINEKVLGQLLISTQHEMGGLLNMQVIIETLSRVKTVEQQKALADSLNTHMPDFLIEHNAAVTGQFYNDYLYYETVATLVKMSMADLKKKATATLRFLHDRYHVTE